MQKQFRDMIYIGVLLGVVGLSYKMFDDLAKKHDTNRDIIDQDIAIIEAMGAYDISQLLPEKEDYVWTSIQKVLDTHRIDGISCIDFIQGDLEMDAYGRYFATFQVLGVNEEEEIKLYDFSIVIQGILDDDIYFMPFGISVKESQGDSTRSDIAETILKSVNGWGMPESAFEERWSNTVHAEQNVEMQAGLSSMEDIYRVQQVIDFMVLYVEDWLNAINEQDSSLVAHYYNEDSDIWKIHQLILKLLQEQSKTIEIYEMDIIEIMHDEAHNHFTVAIKSNVHTYGQDVIEMITRESVYTLTLENGKFKVTNEEIAKKE